MLTACTSKPVVSVRSSTLQSRAGYRRNDGLVISAQMNRTTDSQPRRAILGALVTAPLLLSGAANAADVLGSVKKTADAVGEGLKTGPPNNIGQLVEQEGREAGGAPANAPPSRDQAAGALKKGAEAVKKNTPDLTATGLRDSIVDKALTPNSPSVAFNE